MRKIISSVKLSCKAVITFFVAFTIFASMIGVIIFNDANIERLTMERIIMEKSIKINEVVSRLLYKTQVLSSFIIQNNGDIDNFNQIAATIVDDPSILNVLIAPSGVVSEVYPLRGNEAVVGLDFLGEGDGNEEAIIAKETGQLVLGGPFDLIQGGQALVGRMPVFLDDPDGSKSFWGLVSVTLKYPEILTDVGLDTLEMQGLAYEIWRVSPDTKESQIIAKSGDYRSEYKYFVEQQINILNAEWYFRIFLIHQWYERTEYWVIIIIGVLISILAAHIVQSNYTLNLMRTKLEDLAQMDSLTQIFNRHHFMSISSALVDKALKAKNDCFIIIFDVDHFKKVNDTYGHSVGDEVLRTIVERIKNSIRPDDVFARYGGEEFILFIRDADEDTVTSLAERLRLKIAEAPIKGGTTHIPVSASFGIARAAPVNDLETAIKLADEALYRAKREGRDRVVFYEHESTTV